MAHYLLAEPSASTKSFVNRLRGTRVNAAVPIILSGRDASGQAFSDEAHTVLVSLHGALLQTPRQLQVGMQVTTESPRTGMREKAIWVRCNEPRPGIEVYPVDRV